MKSFCETKPTMAAAAIYRRTWDGEIVRRLLERYAGQTQGDPEGLGTVLDTLMLVYRGFPRPEE